MKLYATMSKDPGFLKRTQGSWEEAHVVDPYPVVNEAWPISVSDIEELWERSSNEGCFCYLTVVTDYEAFEQHLQENETIIFKFKMR